MQYTNWNKEGGTSLASTQTELCVLEGQRKERRSQQYELWLHRDKNERKKEQTLTMAMIG
jgi:hypothetical protein